MLNPLRAIRDFFWNRFVRWLTYEGHNRQAPLSDFERLRYELRPGDVVLVEGRSNVSDIIKSITQSIWTHSCLYIGRLHDIDNFEARSHIQKYFDATPEDQLIIESLLGMGTVANVITRYKGEHLRICRPKGLTRQDAQHVIGYAIRQLGTDYNVRQLMDLARFMFPYWYIPKRWRSTLFEHNAGRPTKTVCSSMMAEAFASVHFPIQPVLHRDENGKLRIYRRNTRLITPPDFDYSPYFDVIKYPLLDFDELAVYRTLPWDRTGVHCNEIGDCLVTDKAGIELVLKATEAHDDVENTDNHEPNHDDVNHIHNKRTRE
jgi:Permuted papain-like amidase enzyme, YaeF/YiiX, C92 family